MKDSFLQFAHFTFSLHCELIIPFFEFLLERHYDKVLHKASLLQIFNYDKYCVL